MTNLSKKLTQKDMQSHIQEEAFKLIDNYLPEFYASEAKEILLKQEIIVDLETIQAIKNKRGKKNPLYLKVINVLVEIAVDNKKTLEKIQSKIDNH